LVSAKERELEEAAALEAEPVVPPEAVPKAKSSEEAST
jgi:hypothetical protein